MKEKEKKKWLILLGVIASFAIVLMSCASGANYAAPTEEKEDFIILWSAEFDERCADLAFDMLEKEGFWGECCNAREADMKKLSREYEIVICIGREVAGEFLSHDSKTPAICCITDSLPWESTREGVVSIAPMLTAESMAEVVCTLFSREDNIALVSDKKGGEDLQAACDLLDSLGVDYRAQLLLDKSYEAVASEALSCGFDAVILPVVLSEEDGDLSDILSVAMGDGEKMLSALSFSLSEEAVADKIAAVFKRKARGKAGEPSLPAEGFYSLYIKEWAREKMMDSGVGIVAEGYEIIIVP